MDRYQLQALPLTHRKPPLIQTSPTSKIQGNTMYTNMPYVGIFAKCPNWNFMLLRVRRPSTRPKKPKLAIKYIGRISE
ncbi:hypothetical protein SS50377_20742 [Spironucleus salmonicida]|uniref:Uncharacterized protein n=1 Tax=Spironucleus salmonicida TaxID=348837 RepID=A0A9P8LZX8_9EUKA|nr:hypothetical protein SS50377_20718 [Spironucleus salmonicida]KAH0577390.1 hypothetical protein SS50377_20742 [Spironucleus salmonicida]